MNKPVNIKGTRQGLVILFDSDAEFEEVKNYLRKKMTAAQGFFKGAKFALHDDHHDIPESQKSELENICLQHGLIRTTKKIKLPQPSNNTVTTVNNVAKKSSPPPGETTLLIKQTIRSGQSIKFDGHVVVMGNVHAGAE
ncbi:septum site-determining protein MinC, partial [Peptococcaceae bacterium]|nr:septum site-determining protein MinC [Peptococcaceae bacterium]